MNLARFFRTVFSRITGNSARRGARKLPPDSPARPLLHPTRREAVFVADNRGRRGVGGLDEHVDQKASHCGR